MVAKLHLKPAGTPMETFCGIDPAEVNTVSLTGATGVRLDKEKRCIRCMRAAALESVRFADREGNKWLTGTEVATLLSI